jgi:hypothetical protein
MDDVVDLVVLLLNLWAFKTPDAAEQADKRRDLLLLLLSLLLWLFERDVSGWLPLCWFEFESDESLVNCWDGVSLRLLAMYLYIYIVFK